MQLPPVWHQAWAKCEKRSRTQPGITAEGPVTRHIHERRSSWRHGKGSSKKGQRLAPPALSEGLRGWIDNCLAPALAMG